jgi:serine/threonine-protein kinase
MSVSPDASLSRRYRLIAEIGRGGMAEVYLAVSQGPGGFNKLVVVKKALQDLALQPEILAMFLDEARLAARMNHPNVVQTYELGEEDGRQFIAMEHLDGQPYSRILVRLRSQSGGLESMSLAHHVRIILDALAGLHHAHELRDFDGTPLHVVHRDVTPQNLFVTYDGSIKVVDFGIAKAQDSSSRTVTGEIKGKVTYMSPEQVRGELLDRRSDLFAVGVMLWEAIAGRRMWKDLPDMAVINELLQGRIPPLASVAPHVPPDLARIVDRALSFDREGRFPSALAMHRELEHFAITSGARVDGAEVGRLVSELFEEERQRVRAVVETQLGSLRWTGENPRAQNLPVIPAPPASFTGRDYGQPVIPTNSGASVPMRPSLAAPKRSIAAPLVGVVLAAGLVAAVLFQLMRSSDRPSAAAAGTSHADATQASSEADSVTLKVKVTPPDAKIYLDGVLLGAGSFDGKVRRGGEGRVLRIEADGYAPQEEKVALTADLMTSFALLKAEAETPAVSASAAVRPTGPGPGGRPFPTARPTGRPIDSESPYKNP